MSRASWRRQLRRLASRPYRLARRSLALPRIVAEKYRYRDGMVPPPHMVFVGDGDFEAVGREFFGYFVDLGRLRPSERVLDVGCGIGRMAVPLTAYLDGDGEYWGFDIVGRGIRWCQGRISTRFPGFHFLHVDVHNDRYNPGGNIRARDFRFPFDDAFFDFVFLTSVFTHMLPDDLDHYLQEIARVLKPGGRTMITLFLLNEESRGHLSAGRSTLDFRYTGPGYSTISDDNPEAAVAYDERPMLRRFEEHGFMLDQPVHYGSWCGRETYVSYQDMVVITKT